MNWHSIRVSMLENVHSTNPGAVTLGAWAQATKRSNLNTPKADRPALMPHGYFVGGRSARHCNQQSGVIQFDIDVKDNLGLDHADVKRRCAELTSIYFCAISATGGMWGIARRTGDTDNQLNELERALGVRLDKANSQSVAALRFASYDPNPYELHRNT